jgi:hypothetical protein
MEHVTTYLVNVLSKESLEQIQTPHCHFPFQQSQTDLWSCFKDCKIRPIAYQHYCKKHGIWIAMNSLMYCSQCRKRGLRYFDDAVLVYHNKQFLIGA